MAEFFSKYDCICPQYDWVCTKYDWICPKYKKMSHNSDLIYPEYNWICKKNLFALIITWLLFICMDLSFNDCIFPKY